MSLSLPDVLLAYTAGFLFALTIAVGALLFVMIAHTARARWFGAFQRLTGAVAATMPVFVVLFAPIALGVKWLYPWARPLGELDLDARAWATHAHPWLNVPFFLARSFLYLVLWSVLATLLHRDSVAFDARPSRALLARQRLVSAAGIPVMAITLTLAAFDWVMSLNARWASDILGVYLFAGAFAGAIGTTAVLAWLAKRAGLLRSPIGPAHFHALGRVLLVTVIFWAYIAFVQFLLVWIADMPREASFYDDRAHAGWGVVAAVLACVHFGAPFLLLLSRPLKRAPGQLAAVGACVVAAHGLDVYWLVVPALHHGMHWFDPLLILAPFAIAAVVGAWRFAATGSIPARDPSAAESLRYEAP